MAFFAQDVISVCMEATGYLIDLMNEGDAPAVFLSELD